MTDVRTLDDNQQVTVIDDQRVQVVSVAGPQGPAGPPSLSPDGVITAQGDLIMGGVGGTPTAFNPADKALIYRNGAALTGVAVAEGDLVIGGAGGTPAVLTVGALGATVRYDGMTVRTSKDAIDADWYSDLQDAINASSGRPIIVPTARSQANPLSVPTATQNKFHLIGNGLESQITYTGAGEFFTLDPSISPATGTRRQFWKLENLRIVGPGMGVAGSVGLFINNGISGTIQDVTVTGFETGVIYDGLDLVDGAACYYNNAFNLVTTGNGINILLRGVANSNKFFGGRAALGTIGVQVADGVNDASFLGMDIEANTLYGMDLAGYGCQFIGCRHENQTSTFEIRFDETGGEGRKHTVIGYLSHANPNSRISWDVLRDNLVLFGGFINLGDQGNAAALNVLNLSRSQAADAKALVDLADTFASSGAPIGIRYNGRRTGTIGVELTRFDGTANRTWIRLMNNLSTAAPEIWMGPANSNAVDTCLTRLAANVAGTASGDKFVANAGLGVGNSVAATAVGSVSRKMEVFDAAGVSIGFVPIYSTIT